MQVLITSVTGWGVMKWTYGQIREIIDYQFMEDARKIQNILTSYKPPKRKRIRCSMTDRLRDGQNWINWSAVNNQSTKDSQQCSSPLYQWEWKTQNWNAPFKELNTPTHKFLLYVKFEVPTALILRIQVFRVVKWRSGITDCQRFEGTYCPTFMGWGI